MGVEYRPAVRMPQVTTKGGLAIKCNVFSYHAFLFSGCVMGDSQISISQLY